MRLKRGHDRRFRQPEVAIRSHHFTRRDVELHVVAHVLRERDVLRNLALGEYLESNRDIDEGSLAARMQMKVEMDLRPGLDQPPRVLGKDVAVFPQRILVEEKSNRILLLVLDHI